VDQPYAHLCRKGRESPTAILPSFTGLVVTQRERMFVRYRVPAGFFRVMANGPMAIASAQNRESRRYRAVDIPPCDNAAQPRVYSMAAPTSASPVPNAGFVGLSVANRAIQFLVLFASAWWRTHSFVHPVGQPMAVLFYFLYFHKSFRT